MLRKRRKSESGEEKETSERKQAELYWLHEHAAQQFTWDQQAELNYKQLAQRQQNKVFDVNSPELFNYKQSSEHPVMYLGVIRGLNFQPITQTGKSEFVDMIDLAQRQGRIPWTTNSLDARILIISRYEIKVTDTQKLQIYHRHTLHQIVGILYFEDAFGKLFLSFQLQTSKPILFDFFIYEVANEAESKNICLAMAQAFECIHKRMTAPN